MQLRQSNGQFVRVIVAVDWKSEHAQPSLELLVRAEKEFSVSCGRVFETLPSGRSRTIASLSLFP